MVERNFSQGEVLRSLGDPKELSRRLERFREDQIFVDEHFEKLYVLYPEQFIAVKDKKVIASAPTREQFLEIIRNDQGRHRCSVWRHLERNPRPQIFSAA